MSKKKKKQRKKKRGSKQPQKKSLNLMSVLTTVLFIGIVLLVCVLVVSQNSGEKFVNPLPEKTVEKPSKLLGKIGTEVVNNHNTHTQTITKTLSQGTRGHVINYKMQHGSKKHAGQVSFDDKYSIVYHQLLILNQLADRKAIYVFTENNRMSADEFAFHGPNDKFQVRGLTLNFEQLKQDVRVAFQNTQWKKMQATSEQGDMLYNYGASMVYCIITPTARLMQTVDEQKLLIREQKLEALGFFSGYELPEENQRKIDALVMELEYSMTEYVDKLFAINPGVTAHIIAGATHDFYDNFKGKDIAFSYVYCPQAIPDYILESMEKY